MCSGALLHMGDYGLPKRVVSVEMESAGKTWAGGKELMDVLRGKLSSGIWHHGGLKHRHTINRPWGLVQHSITVGAKGAIGLWPRG